MRLALLMLIAHHIDPFLTQWMDKNVTVKKNLGDLLPDEVPEKLVRFGCALARWAALTRDFYIEDAEKVGSLCRVSLCSMCKIRDAF